MTVHGWIRDAGSAAFAVAALVQPVSLAAAAVPSGFVDSPYVYLPSDTTAMEFAPDGRLFVSEQSGKLLVVDNGTLLPTPFVTLPVEATGERGLLGVAFDPDFATSHFVYVYYTAKTPVIHNRVSRLTADGNVAVPGSERVLLELTPLGSSTSHNGGAIHFGNDSKLYIAVGDNRTPDNSQVLTNVLGKILRINRNGTIPTSNPFYASTTGVNRSIWALGLRNPFTSAFQHSTGWLFINDVGEKTYEEIDRGKAGANYGWPTVEGPTTDPAFTGPIHYYGHENGQCAITGGAFYEPSTPTFPAEYQEQYFFTDYCAGWIRRLDPLTNTVTDFATGLVGPVDLKVGPDGGLYYLSRQTGTVGRITYAVSQPPAIGQQPIGRTIGVGQSVTFTVGATGSTPLNFQWRRNGTWISGATSATYTRSNVQLADNGALFDVVVRNAYGRAVSAGARLTVLNNAAPTASITQPLAGTTYAGGNVITYAGTASDAEDGALPASAFTWSVDFHHGTHVHPFLLPMSGATSGSFTIPSIGETSTDVFYRINLTVTDSVGLQRTVSRDLLPRKSTLTLSTNPSGLQINLDGQPVTTPYTFASVVGIKRRLEAVSPQTALNATWVFSSWTDGAPQVRTIATPSVNRTYTATFVVQ